MANEQLRNAAHNLTHATGHPEPRPRLENYGPARPARIASLHSGALFIAQETHLPVPSVVQMYANNVHFGELATLAEHYGVPIVRGDTSTWIDIPVSDPELHGVKIIYTMFAAVESPVTPMDLPARGEGITADPWADVMGEPCANGRCTNPAAHAEGGHDR